AVVQSAQGAWFGGVRIENVSFPLTIPAVQNALFCCLSEGQTPVKLFADFDRVNDAKLHFWRDELNIEINSLNGLEAVSFRPLIRQLSGNEVKNELVELLDHRLADYSHFQVSALAETSEGYISGIN